MSHFRIISVLMALLIGLCISAPARAQELGKHFVVSAGVLLQNDTLRYTVNDARLFHRVMGDGASKAVLLTSDATSSAGLPTKKNISNALLEAVQLAGPNDVIWFHLSGHGAQFGDSVLALPHDFDKNDPRTGIDLSVLRKEMASISKARAIIYVIDTCYSGRTKSTVFTNAASMFATLNGSAVLASCGPEETSLELPSLRQGVFTYFLARGLAGEASPGPGKPITLRGLQDYVREEIASIIKNSPGMVAKQTPVFSVSGTQMDQPVAAPNPQALQQIPEPPSNLSAVPMQPLPPSVIVDVQATGGSADLVKRLSESRIRARLLEQKYPVVANELAAPFLLTLNQSNTDAGRLAHEKFGSAFLLRVKASVSTRRNTVGEETTWLAELTLTGQVIDAKGKVLVEADSDSDSGLAQQGVAFSEERAIRAALDKAIRALMNRAMAAMNDEVKPFLVPAAGGR